jgi:hypothetical protein
VETPESVWKLQKLVWKLRNSRNSCGNSRNSCGNFAAPVEKSERGERILKNQQQKITAVLYHDKQKTQLDSHVHSERKPQI